MVKTHLQERFKSEADRAASVTKQSKARIRRASSDFSYFCAHYLDHYFYLPPADFHRELIDLITNQKYCAVAAPREHAKSTVVSFAYPLWGILTGRNRFILIISASLDLARSFLIGIRDELELNDQLIADFGVQYPEVSDQNKWSETMLVTRNGCCLMARGAGSSMRGLRFRQYRPDLIILDDIETDEGAASPAQREKLWNWLMRSVMGLSKDAQIFDIGTVLHYDSVLNRLVAGKSPGWTSRKFKAICDDGSPLWPERWPLAALEEKRRQIGSLAFSSEFLNTPIDEQSALFRAEWITYYTRKDISGLNLDIYQFVDPSLGGSSRSDYSAIVTLGRNRMDGMIYVLHLFCERVSPERLMTKIFELNERYEPILIGFETVGFQKVLKQWLDERSRKSGVYLPVREIDQKGINKEARITRLSPLVEQGLIRFPEHRAERLIEQLLTFPKGDHDDAPDALEGAVSLIRSGAFSSHFRSKMSIFKKVVGF